MRTIQITTKIWGNDTIVTISGYSFAAHTLDTSDAISQAKKHYNIKDL